MYKNVEAELKRAGKTKGELARFLGIRPTTLSNKLNGKSIITLTQALSIKQFIGVEMALEELFSA
jgi:plasmid maintenance system antidote protein VapI